MTKRASTDDAESWDGLAGLLDIPVRRLHEYRKRDGSPDGKSLSDWEDWISSHASSSTAADGESSAIDLLIKNETHRKLKIKNDRDEETLINEALQGAHEVMKAEGARLRTIFLGLVPARLGKALIGKTSTEIVTEVKAILDAAFQEAKRGAKK